MLWFRFAKHRFYNVIMLNSPSFYSFALLTSPLLLFFKIVHLAIV